MKKWVFWLVGACCFSPACRPRCEGWIGAYNYQIVILVGINIILAVSLNLINGITGQFSIGHAGFYAVGAYTSASLVYYGESSIRAHDRRFCRAMAQDAVLLLLGSVGGRRGRGNCGPGRGHSVAAIARRLPGDRHAGIRRNHPRAHSEHQCDRRLARVFRHSRSSAISSGSTCSCLITIVTVHNLVNSSYGRAFISIRDDEIAAEAMGVDTTRFKVLSFVISSMFAGIAGGLFGHFTMYLHPNSFLFTTSFYLIIMIVVGGLGSIEGAVLGAILVTVVLEVFRGFGAFRLVNFSGPAGA